MTADKPLYNGFCPWCGIQFSNLGEGVHRCRRCGGGLSVPSVETGTLDPGCVEDAIEAGIISRLSEGVGFGPEEFTKISAGCSRLQS